MSNRNKEKGSISLGLAAFFVLVFAVWGVVRVVNNIQFNRNCGGYLKRAADANTVELASKELSNALAYIEQNHLTSGYTSTLYTSPSEDVGFWYKNLKASQEELQSIRPESPQLERSNVLMKLRETLLDKGEKTESVTEPPGISIYPNNVAYAWWGWLSGLLAVVCIIVFVKENS